MDKVVYIFLHSPTITNGESRTFEKSLWTVTDDERLVLQEIESAEVSNEHYFTTETRYVSQEKYNSLKKHYKF